MILNQCTATNFGSYATISFNFNNLGLCLISGPTGSGKSSLFDLPCWILFGVTAKGGSVDEVKNWKFVDKPTAGTLQVKLKNTTIDITIEVTRVRGKPSENDLYWTEGGKIIRGKDLKDTQAMLEKRLGVTCELYLAGSYFNEFSSLSSFFTNTAKARRELLELIADTSLAETLSNKASGDKKAKKSLGNELDKSVIRATLVLEHAQRHQDQAKKNFDVWAAKQSELVLEAVTKRNNFDVIKNSKIEAITTSLDAWEVTKIRNLQFLNNKKDSIIAKIAILKDKGKDLASCPTCGTPSLEAHKIDLLLKDCEKIELQVENLSHQVNPYKSNLKEAKELKNEFQDIIDSILEDTNSYDSKHYSNQVEKAQKELKEINKQLLEYRNRISLLDELQDISVLLRGSLIKKVVGEVQSRANVYLEKFFDSEIRLDLSVPDNDSIELNIRKNGYDCSYSQLSKGQRGLLKLCFALSIMTIAANKAGVHFQNIFLDEALDGLDSELKVKSFNLLSELNTKHATVMVIDHSAEFKSCFPRKYAVALREDESIIDEC